MIINLIGILKLRLKQEMNKYKKIKIISLMIANLKIKLRKAIRIGRKNNIKAKDLAIINSHKKETNFTQIENYFAKTMSKLKSKE